MPLLVNLPFGSLKSLSFESNSCKRRTFIKFKEPLHKPIQGKLKDKNESGIFLRVENVEKLREKESLNLILFSQMLKNRTLITQTFQQHTNKSHNPKVQPFSDVHMPSLFLIGCVYMQSLLPIRLNTFRF